MESHRPRRVLVAEDDADTRAAIIWVLRADGYEVIEASDGREATDRIAGSMLFEDGGPPPDLIITDVRMPGISGLSLVAGIRARHWKTPIIVITAHDTDTIRAEAKRIGADVVFIKPFDLDDLRTAVTNMLHDRGRSGTHALDLPDAVKRKLT
jgi:DNA-binding response OmpR family regulator